MSYLNTLLESEVAQNFIAEHEDLIAENELAVHDFRKVLKAFVLNNPQEFIGENTEQTFKNIMVFSEVATAQFMKETSTLVSGLISESTETSQRALDDYL